MSKKYETFLYKYILATQKHVYYFKCFISNQKLEKIFNQSSTYQPLTQRLQGTTLDDKSITTSREERVESYGWEFAVNG